MTTQIHPAGHATATGIIYQMVAHMSEPHVPAYAILLANVVPADPRQLLGQMARGKPMPIGHIVQCRRIDASSPHKPAGYWARIFD